MYTNLFVGEHEQTRLAELLVRQHAVQLLAADGQPLPVRRVDHHDHELENCVHICYLNKAKYVLIKL